jgi:predicted short-subunit dehydrogenase-like oxidoreductase (DUF2520 family)
VAARRQKLLIVGRGRVGMALARAWRLKGHAVALAAHGSPRKSDATIVFFTVPDRAIGDVARAWSSKLAPDALKVHTAGALGLEVFEGPGPTAALHPLLAIASPRTPLVGCAVGIETRRRTDRARLGALARDAGMIPLRHAPADRARYHLGAVLAANSQAPLLEAAVAELVAAGIDETEARRALAHLARSAIAAWEAQGGPQGLTGPVARGDATTIARHLRALTAGTTRELYLALSRAALALAALRSPVPEGLAAVSRALKGQ